MKIAVLDLGSNSFHLLVARAEPEGKVVRLEKAREMVRLGSGTLQTGVIDDDGMRRALDAIGWLVGRARKHARARLVAVATSAVREARNGAELVAAARELHGIDIQVLSGDEEARLIWLGARAGLAGRVAVVDVGGGSVEMAFGDEHGCLLTRSLPLGVLRLREQLVPADGYVSERTAELLRRRVRETAHEAARAVSLLHPDHVVLTSGTARTVAALAHELADRPRGTTLTLAQVSRLVIILSKFKPTDMSELGVEEGRVDTIAPGAVVIETLLELLEARSVQVSDRALREGVALREAAGGAAAAIKSVQPRPNQLPQT